MNILVTAGPTREPIDPVRFISNRSSGKMGYAIAAAACERHHPTRLISGPVSLPSPAGVETISVLTAQEMCDAVTAHLPWCHALIMVAAVADWRPVLTSAQKMKKSEDLSTLRLERTPDILRSVAPAKGSRIFIGFAAETQHLREEAERKLREKNLDLIVANDVSRTDSGFETDLNRVTLLMRDGTCEEIALTSKREIASRLISWLESQSPAPDAE